MTKERPDSDDEASTHNRAEVINVKTGKAVTEKASWITTGLRVATLAALVLGISYGNLVKGNKEHSPLDVESNQQPSGVDFMVQVLQKTGGRNLCSLAGYIEGTCLDFETVEAENKALHPYLEELMKSKFFRLLKVDLFKKCKLWENEDKCTQEGCTVDPVDDNEIPASWRDENEAEIEEDGQDQWNKQRFGSFLEMMEKDKVGKGHVFDKKDYSVVNNEKTGDGVWVDLYANPEKFTGYAGSTANQIWVSIYTDYCFGVQPKMQDTAAGWGSQKYGVDNKKSPFVEPPANRRKLKGFLEDLMESEREISLKSDVPRELELFYQAISGLHASTSTHICYENYDAETNTWKPNLGCFIARIGAFPERLTNIYFDFALLLRSIQKIAPLLRSYNYGTGDAREDEKIKTLVSKVLERVNTVRDPINEKKLFTSKVTRILKEEFKTNFRNVSEIMDCTGCEKCRLWGKTQVLGLGTALKILFELPETFPSSSSPADIAANQALLKRNEIVSLLVTFNQFSRSINDIGQFRNLYQHFLDSR